MDFQTGHLYHIYNQSNNKNNIFFNQDNYLFFLKKIATNILPFCDILAWCLMPNHFHLMVLVNSLEAKFAYYTPGATSNSKCDSTTPGATRSRTRSEKTRTDTLQKSLGIMLASYTRASTKRKNLAVVCSDKKQKRSALLARMVLLHLFLILKTVQSFSLKHPSVNILKYVIIIF